MTPDKEAATMTLLEIALILLPGALLTVLLYARVSAIIASSIFVTACIADSCVLARMTLRNA